MCVNPRLKALVVIGQRKTFYRQRILESRCARKETVDIDILVTSRNGDRKVMQSIRTMGRPPTRKRKWNQLSQHLNQLSQPVEVTTVFHTLAYGRFIEIYSNRRRKKLHKTN